MTLPAIDPIIKTGNANTKPNNNPTIIETKILNFNKVIKKANIKNPVKTINVAHFVLAILNLPVRLSHLYINLALMEFSGGAG